MTTTFVASAKAESATATTTLTLTVPTGVATTHLGVIEVLTSISTATTITAPGWTSRVSNPAGTGNMCVVILTRLGGLVAGNTVTITAASTQQMTAFGVWYNTAGYDVESVGTVGTRNAVSGTTVTYPSAAVSGARDVLLIGGDRTTGTPTVSSWSPSTPTVDGYFTSTDRATLAHGATFAHIRLNGPGSAVAYVETLSLASTNASAVQIVISEPIPFSTLVENFTTKDTTKWTWQAAASVVSGQASLVTNSSYTGNIETPVGYSLAESSIYFKVPQRANVGNGGTETYAILYDAATNLSSKNAVLIDVIGTNINFIRRDSAGASSTLATVAYSATTHLWWRIRSASGTVYFDTSPDGGTWTQQTSWVATIPLTNMKVQFGTGYSGTEPTPGTAIFDNVNVPGGPQHVADYASAQGTAASQTASVSPSSGDLLLYMAWTGDANYVPAAPTGGGLTWTLVGSGNSTNTIGNAEAVIYSATATSTTTFTVTGTVTGSGAGTQLWGFQVQRWSNARLANNWSISGSTTAQLTFTQAKANSALAMVVSDYNSISGASRTYVTASAGAFTETFYSTTTNSTNYAGYYADDGVVGSKTVGLSAPTGQLAAMVVVEITTPPALRGSAAKATYGTSATALNPGTQAGDLIVVNYYSDSIIATPSGWTLAGSINTNYNLYVFWKYATASEPASWAMPGPNGASSLTGTMVFTNTATTNPIPAFATNSGLAATTQTAASVTATNRNAMYVNCFAQKTGNATRTTSFMTEAFDVAEGAFGSFAANYLLFVAPNSSGNITSTASVAGDYESVSFIINPFVASSTTPWVNKTLVQLGRDSTGSSTINFGPATAGNLLVAVMYGGVTSTTPTGWTLPASGSAVGSGGLYVWYKTATSGESSFATTHNGSNYPVVAVVYEFNGQTFTQATNTDSGAGQGNIGTGLTGMSGTHTLFCVAGDNLSTGTAGTGGTTTATWSNATGTEDVDCTVTFNTTDAYAFSDYYLASTTVASWAPAVTFSPGVGTNEKIYFVLSPSTGAVNFLDVGSTAVSNVMFGSTAVTALYVGTTKVWG